MIIALLPLFLARCCIVSSIPRRKSVPQRNEQSNHATQSAELMGQQRSPIVRMVRHVRQQPTQDFQ